MTDTQKAAIVESWVAIRERIDWATDEMERQEELADEAKKAGNEKLFRRHSRKAESADNKNSFYLGQMAGIESALEALGYKLVKDDCDNLVDIVEATQ